MSATAGFNGRLGVTSSSTTMSSSDYVAGARSVSFDRVRALLETTAFDNQTAAERSYIAGLKDVDFSWDQDYTPADSPTAIVDAAWASGDSVWVQLAYDAGTNTAGWKVEAKISDIGVKVAVDGKLEASIKAKATGAVAALV